jgi:hypothetical protein
MWSFGHAHRLALAALLAGNIETASAVTDGGCPPHCHRRRRHRHVLRQLRWNQLPPMPLTPPVTVQLINDRSECWTAEYVNPARRNTVDLYKNSTM